MSSCVVGIETSERVHGICISARFAGQAAPAGEPAVPDAGGVDVEHVLPRGHPQAAGLLRLLHRHHGERHAL